MKGIILDLCGGTGSWSRPWEAAGYDVRVLTLPEYDVRELVVITNPAGKSYLIMQNKCKHDGESCEAIATDEIVGILAAPPCTEFSVLNCRAEARERDEAAGMEIVDACMYVITNCNPKWWALENPRGYLRKYLGPPTMTFQPWHYGDPWTKAFYEANRQEGANG